MLRSKEFSTRSLIKRMKAEVICTTDDPTDNLEHHKSLKTSFDVTVLPTWRPDNIIKTEDPARFNAYIKKLETASNIEIKNIDTLLEALDSRHKFFHEMGC